MNPLAIHYGDHRVGRLAEAEIAGRTCIFFEYDPEFLRTGIELSPHHLPLRPGLLTREGSRPCDQLPGLFEDSLPDAWGLGLMLDWFRRRNVPTHQVTPLMQLSYVGDRGMGALTYHPEGGPDEQGAIDLNEVYAAALAAGDTAAWSDTLVELGSSAGGAQPKALIGIGTGEPRYWSGTRALPAGYEAWLVKFTPKALRRDQYGADGRVEYAYALMARAAGIDLPPCRLLKATRSHFAVKRFDREGNERIHHHTLARLTQTPGGDLDYETLLQVTSALTRDHREVVRAFRRAAFNVLAHNDDDHGRNHGFLLRGREWKLGPAYDVTFRRLRERGLAVCGERRAPGIADLMKLAERTAVAKADAAAIIDEVRAALVRWPTFADEAGVPATMAAEVAAAILSSNR